VNGLIGAVRNNGGLVKNGSGTLAVTYSNTFSGGTTINAGTLRIDGAGKLGSGAYAGAIGNNGVFDYASTATQSLSGPMSGTGTLTKSGNSTLTLSGNNTYGGATTVNGGTLVFSKTPTNNPGPTAFTINPGGTLQLNNTGATWDGCGNGVTVNGGAATLGGSGTVVYYGAGNVKMTGGTLSFTSNWAPYGNLGVTTKASASTASITGTAGYQYNPAFNFNVERGTAASDLTVALALGGNGALNKSGTGMLLLTAACGFTGATSVNDGTLLINGSLANSANAVTVAAAATLGGTGTIGRAVTVNGALAPGANGIGKLTVNNALTLATGSKLDWEISDWAGTAGSGHDTLTVTSLALTATAASPVTIRPKDLALVNFTEATKTFVLVHTTSGITGFSADKFAVDASGLTAPHGTWAVQQSGNDLLLAYTAQTNPDANGNGILDTWETARFGNANAGSNLPNDDPDHDGLVNLLEYALDTNPVAGNASPLAHQLAAVGDGHYLRLTVAKNPAATNVTYTVESGGSFDDWSDLTTTIESNTATQLIVRDNVRTTNATRRFLRLRVQANP
jgi:autotransporter-associated beta strand protein